MELLLMVFKVFLLTIVVLISTYCIGRMVGLGLGKSLEDLFNKLNSPVRHQSKEKENGHGKSE